MSETGGRVNASLTIARILPLLRRLSATSGRPCAGGKLKGGARKAPPACDGGVGFTSKRRASECLPRSPGMPSQDRLLKLRQNSSEGLMRNSAAWLLSEPKARCRKTRYTRLYLVLLRIRTLRWCTGLPGAAPSRDSYPRVFVLCHSPALGCYLHPSSRLGIFPHCVRPFRSAIAPPNMVGGWKVY